MKAELHTVVSLFTKLDCLTGTQVRFGGVLSEAHVTGVEFKHRGGGHSGEYPANSNLKTQIYTRPAGSEAHRTGELLISHR